MDSDELNSIFSDMEDSSPSPPMSTKLGSKNSSALRSSPSAIGSIRVQNSFVFPSHNDSFNSSSKPGFKMISETRSTHQIPVLNSFSPQGRRSSLYNSPSDFSSMRRSSLLPNPSDIISSSSLYIDVHQEKHSDDFDDDFFSNLPLAKPPKKEKEEKKTPPKKVEKPQLPLKKSSSSSSKKSDSLEEIVDDGSILSFISDEENNEQSEFIKSEKGNEIFSGIGILSNTQENSHESAINSARLPRMSAENSITSEKSKDNNVDQISGDSGIIESFSNDQSDLIKDTQNLEGGLSEISAIQVVDRSTGSSSSRDASNKSSDDEINLLDELISTMNEEESKDGDSEFIEDFESYDKKIEKIDDTIDIKDDFTTIDDPTTQVEILEDGATINDATTQIDINEDFLTFDEPTTQFKDDFTTIDDEKVSDHVELFDELSDPPEVITIDDDFDDKTMTKDVSSGVEVIDSNSMDNDKPTSIFGEDFVSTIKHSNHSKSIIDITLESDSEKSSDSSSTAQVIVEDESVSSLDSNGKKKERKKRKKKINPNLSMERTYATTIRGKREAQIHMSKDNRVNFSMPPVKNGPTIAKGSVKPILLYEPQVLSSATLRDVNTSYRDTLKVENNKLSLLNQSISSMLLSRRSQCANSHDVKAVSLKSVNDEIQACIAARNEREAKILASIPIE